jgi:hypothetical protein
MTLGNIGQASKGMQASGVQPIGNGTGSNIANAGPVPLLPTNTVGTPGSLVNSPTNPIMQSPAGTQTPGVVPGYSADPNSFTGGYTPGGVTQAAQHQLNDVYGQGVGGQIGSLEANLGSGDSTYMQAYQAAMAQPNAENMATLQTSLSNAGVGMNSSTAAIAQSDLLTGETAQEGLQEQQLQQTDQQNLLGLVQGTQSAANKQASTSVWGDIGSVLGSIGSDVGTALGSTDLSKVI